MSGVNPMFFGRDLPEWPLSLMTVLRLRAWFGGFARDIGLDHGAVVAERLQKEQLLVIVIGLMGAFSLAGAVMNWDWFMLSRKAAFFVKLFGRNGARVLYGLLLAYAGRSDEAVAEGRRAIALERASPLPETTQYTNIQMARIHLALNQPEEAIDYLERAVNRGSFTSGYLRLEPTYRSLHGNPRFDRLVAAS